jgi:N-acetylglucosamine kinase-like BadF-type ATPase
VYLGVDGGGTKTSLCLVTRDGDVVASALAPTCYYLGEDVDLVERVLRQGVTAVCERAGIAPEQVEYAFFGLPAYGEVSADVPALDAAPRAVLGHDRYSCDNDMVCGWAGSLGATDGINVISGTGSMTYGERQGARVRVGGWGELFGDEGSGHWIGVRCLQAFSRMSDGRSRPGPLLATVREHLGLRTDLDVIDVVLNRWGAARREVAGLAPLVVRIARAGDATARGILEDAGRELAELAGTTRRRLGFAEDEPAAISYSGGMFSVEEVRRAFTRRLEEEQGRYEIREPLFPPVVGAALYAARRAGTPLGDAALQRLRTDVAPDLLVRSQRREEAAPQERPHQQP